ncbi:hypothetical protein SAMN04515667_1848 [Formosa sp. Hel1_31_208]|uniref:hypothetical protein n=1 Tax=Formosa sp. Hel1_31_208 TaxID=1798225 RepID=UPI0008799969|nr:hypothetical protein [Formosa sp. Hel1_31_208]SDS29372.1 hypothetical protein SAMN04515667_1848 [Formosa sp. Hel1_31_208]
MKKIILNAFIILFSLGINAQMGVLGKKAAKQIEILKERPLLVVLWEEGELDGYNENIKKAIDEVWTFSSEIVYVTKDEWRKLSKDKEESSKYAHLYYTVKMLNANAPNHSLVIGLLENKVSIHFVFTPNTGAADLMLSLKNLQLDLAIGNNYKKVVNEQRVEYMQYIKDSLPHKTLYINKNLATKKLLKKIDDVYSYPFKLVSHEDINEAILNKDPDVLFIREFVKAQRPTTKTKFNTGNSETASMHFRLKMIYRAADLKLIGGTGPGDKVDVRDLEMLLQVMKM